MTQMPTWPPSWTERPVMYLGLFECELKYGSPVEMERTDRLGGKPMRTQ